MKHTRSHIKLSMAIVMTIIAGLFAGCGETISQLRGNPQDSAVSQSPTLTEMKVTSNTTSINPDAPIAAAAPDVTKVEAENSAVNGQAVQAGASILKPELGDKPKMWGEQVTGVKRRLDTIDKVIALTFDACGGETGSGYDKKLIDFLIQENIPATLFMNSRWIDANPDIFRQLAANPLFEIENHGTLHKPLSVTGRSVYGIKGTGSLEEARNEVQLNARKIEKLTGRKPKFFRSGTAYYDEIAIQVVEQLGEQAVNFDVLGDAGATYTKAQIVHALDGAHPGSIVISHMNHPEKDTAAGIAAAIPRLRHKGYSFVKLEDYALK